MSNRSDTRITTGRTPPPADADATVSVPRLWLTLLTVLVVLPWLAVGSFWWVDRQASRPAATTPAEPVRSATVGPWGDLRLHPITISPPAEYVPRTWGEVQPSVWHFPLMTGDELETHLVSLGLSRADAQQLRAASRSSTIGTLIVAPDDELVRRLAPDVRTRLYTDLGRFGAQFGGNLPINYDQVTSYRFYGATVDDWLDPRMVDAPTRALVEPYLYGRDGFLFFGDIERIRPAIGDPDVLQRLAKVLLRHATMLVEVTVPDSAAVETMVTYWGRGGRSTDLRPLLESVARETSGSGAIDISHLVPTMMREHLYRYPRPSVDDLERPLLANCLWTALNFFAPTPDDRYLDPAVAIATLKSDYYLVQDNFQLGDIVVFSDAGGNLVHVAVYLAGDLVFSKNGTSALAPWSILPIGRLAGHYVEYSSDWRITYHRRKDM